MYQLFGYFIYSNHFNMIMYSILYNLSLSTLTIELYNYLLKLIMICPNILNHD